MLLERCLGQPGAVSWCPAPGEPVAAVHAALCPAGHHGSVPVVVLDLSEVGGLPAGPVCATDGYCPVCPGERLMPAGIAPAATGGPVARCRCCRAAWWAATGWWGCPDTGRLISVAGPVSEQARVDPAPDAGRICARALAGFLVSGPGPVAQALAESPFGVGLYEHAGRRYAVVTGGSAQIKAVFKVSRAGTLRRLDWLRASAGPAALGLLSTPSHRR